MTHPKAKLCLWFDTGALEAARSAVEQVTRTPDYTDKGAKTMKIIGEGLTACQEDLAQAKTDREAYYQNLAEHPELATQPVATVPETTPETTVAEAA